VERVDLVTPFRPKGDMDSVSNLSPAVQKIFSPGTPKPIAAPPSTYIWTDMPRGPSAAS
jgi:hypothetical protein